MKIKGRLIFKCENADELISVIAKSLTPDNLPDIKTTSDKDCAVVTFTADKIGTILSSVDDYLMNAKIIDSNLMDAIKDYKKKYGIE